MLQINVKQKANSGKNIKQRIQGTKIANESASSIIDTQTTTSLMIDRYTTEKSRQLERTEGVQQNWIGNTHQVIGSIWIVNHDGTTSDQPASITCFIT